MRIASGRVPLELECSSVILDAEESLRNALKPRDQLPIAARQSSFGDRISAIVGLGVASIGAERCAIAFRSGGAGADEVVRAPCGDSRWDAALNEVLMALENRLNDVAASRGTRRAHDAIAIDSIDTLALSARGIGAIASIKQIGEGLQLAASAFTKGENAVRIAMVAPADRARIELDASMELMARSVFGEIALSSARASLDFWRTHGSESGRQAVGSRRALVQERAAKNYLDDAATQALRAQPAERFARFGEIVAGGGGFDQWMVAIADGDELTLAASSFTVPTDFTPEEGSVLSESFRRHIVIGHWCDRDAIDADSLKTYIEDRVFAGSYVCIPFGSGAIALASRDAHASAARAEAIVERLTPFATTWMLEREAARRNRLVRQLALRMFSAIDEERARIARDLHDDQAQLLAAAKIAIDGPVEAARSIFEQVEDELRRKTRELRPATLGNGSLDEAIEREFGRLNRAGVKAKFLHLIQDGAAEKISRPVQQLCFQVIREALANVIRHARAKRVQITVEKGDTTARVSVSDDGRGIGAGNAEGAGLTGVRERLQLMGGTLTVESRTGRTTVIAEIPEPA